jgi:hypothetical protein
VRCCSVLLGLAGVRGSSKMATFTECLAPHPIPAPGLAVPLQSSKHAVPHVPIHLHILQEFMLLGPEGCLPLTVAGGGGSDIVTLSPVLEAGDVLFAAIGLVGMLNAGGAVRACTMSGERLGAEGWGPDGEGSTSLVLHAARLIENCGQQGNARGRRAGFFRRY